MDLSHHAYELPSKKHVIGGKIGGRIAVMRRRGRKRKQILEAERGSTRSHYVENSLLRRLWACRKTDN
jgi:hypothetical protein